MEHDEKHHLEAPGEASLKDIEQLQDRSNLTFLYPKAQKQWTGELLSADERNMRRDAHIEQISRSIRKRFLSIGFLIPLPILMMVAVALAGQKFIKSIEDLPIYIIPLAVATGLLGWLTYASIKKVRAIFYDHAIAIGPFYLTLILLLVPAGISAFFLTGTLHGNDLLTAAAVVGLVEIILSVVFSFLLLFIWTTPVLSGRGKMALLILLGSVLIAVAAFFSLSTLTSIL